MPYKDPNNSQFFTNIVQYAWLAFVACWGGAVNYISRIKRGEVKYSLLSLIGEFIISAFAGILTYWILTYFEMDPLIIIVGVAISGHAGGRTVSVLESAFNNLLSAKINAIQNGQKK